MSPSTVFINLTTLKVGKVGEIQVPVSSVRIARFIRVGFKSPAGNPSLFKEKRLGKSVLYRRNRFWLF